MSIDLERASEVVDGALEHARDIDCAPLTVAVLDQGGHLVAFKREDGSGILRPGIAIGKAWSALGMGMPTRQLAGLAEQLPSFVGAVASIDGASLIPVPGGVLIRDDSGTLHGAVGVSGDVSDVDEDCAVRGVRRAGLHPDVGEEDR